MVAAEHERNEPVAARSLDFGRDTGASFEDLV
jgi:hypothetical protein